MCCHSLAPFFQTHLPHHTYHMEWPLYSTVSNVEDGVEIRTHPQSSIYVVTKSSQIYFAGINHRQVSKGFTCTLHLTFVSQNCEKKAMIVKARPNYPYLHFLLYILPTNPPPLFFVNSSTLFECSALLSAFELLNENNAFKNLIWVRIKCWFI